MYKSCTSNSCEFLEEMGFFFVRKLYRIRSPYVRHVRVISGHPISIGFRGLTGCQRDPRDRGVTCPNLFRPFSCTLSLEDGFSSVSHILDSGDEQINGLPVSLSHFGQFFNAHFRLSLEKLSVELPFHLLPTLYGAPR